VVSHDRYFLERVTDHAVALTGGGLAFLPGGVDEYLRIRERHGGVTTSRPASGSTAQPATGVAAASTDDGTTTSGGGVSAARQRAGQKELSKLERQIARLTETEARLEAELAASAADYARLIELGDELRGVQTDRAGLEERWLEVAEEISG